MQSNNAIVPILSEFVVVNQLDDDNYTIAETQLNYQLKVNKSVVSIINAIDGHRNIEDICTLVNDDSQNNYSVDAIYSLLYDKLSKYGIVVQNNVNVKVRARPNYLKFSITLLKRSITNAMVQPLTVLFSKKILYPLFLFLPVFIGSTLIIFKTEFVESLSNLFSSKFVIYFVLFGVWTFFHELGHAAASKSFGVQPGDIGFAFYLFTPVLYSDVSNIWLLKKRERIIVNLAGIYFELILASTILALYYITRIEILLILPGYLILNTLYNFNPLIKYDGYWILSDVLNIPNLHAKAYGAFGKIVKSPRNFPYNKENVLLATFGFISIVYVIPF
jgi:putative peptide zinc metalloprotease protein